MGLFWNTLIRYHPKSGFISMKRRARFYLILVLSVFIAFVLIDSLGAFDSKSWFEVPHGNHSHYLPKDCDPALAVGDAPTTKPRVDQEIDCQGQIIPLQ